MATIRVDDDGETSSMERPRIKKSYEKGTFSTKEVSFSGWFCSTIDLKLGKRGRNIYFGGF